MNNFTRHTGTAVPLMRSNIDTDQIIPKQFLKRVERSGYGEFLFWDWRFDGQGQPIDDFILNRPEYSAASILIAGPNFGCGSSREHAPWSLLDYGFRVVIAESFADIFYNNSLKNGFLPVRLAAAEINQLAVYARSDPGIEVTIDLEAKTVSCNDIIREFAIDDFSRHCLLMGLDDISLSLQHADAIEAYESRPTIYAFPPT